MTDFPVWLIVVAVFLLPVLWRGLRNRSRHSQYRSAADPSVIRHLDATGTNRPAPGTPEDQTIASLRIGFGFYADAVDRLSMYVPQAADLTVITDRVGARLSEAVHCVTVSARLADQEGPITDPANRILLFGRALLTDPPNPSSPSPDSIVHTRGFAFATREYTDVYDGLRPTLEAALKIIESETAEMFNAYRPSPRLPSLPHFLTPPANAAHQAFLTAFTDYAHLLNKTYNHSYSRLVILTEDITALSEQVVSFITANRDALTEHIHHSFKPLPPQS